MAAYDPIATLQVAFGHSAQATSVAWTTIGSVSDMTISRGRSSVFDAFPTGSLGAAIVDTDRTYDILNGAGSYAGSLVPNTPVRVVVTHSGTEYPRFRGYVDAWESAPLVSADRVQLRASDGFRLLQNARLPESVYETEVRAASPWLYWRLGPDGTKAADISGNGRDGEIEPGVATGSNTVRPFTGPSMDTNGIFAAVQSDNGTIVSFPFTLEMWIRHTESGEPVYTIAEQAATAGTVTTDRWMMFYVESTGLVHFGKAPGGGGSSGDTVDGWWLRDGNVHHVAVVFTSGTSDVLVYVDGEPQTVSSGSGGVSLMSNRIYVGSSGPGGLLVSDPITSASVEISDFIIWDSELTSSEIAANYQSGTSPWFGDTSGTRIGRILDLVEWPSALRDIDNGEVTLGNADLNGVAPLGYLQLIEQTEGGRLFMGQDGSVVFHDGSTVRADTTASAVFSDDGADVNYLYGSLRYSKGFLNLYNHAVVQRKYGVPQEAIDATSVASYGTQTKSQSGLLMRDDGLARSRAEQTVLRWKEPQTWVDSFKVQPQQKSSTWQQTLALELGEHIELEVTPVGVGSQASIEMDLDRLVERITPSIYEFEFAGSPRDPNITNYFTWGSGTAARGWGTGVWA